MSDIFEGRTDREAFEREMIERGFSIREDFLAEGGYASDETDWAFCGWSARDAEVGALKARNEKLLKTNGSYGTKLNELADENETLKARVAQLESVWTELKCEDTFQVYRSEDIQFFLASDVMRIVEGALIASWGEQR